MPWNYRHKIQNTPGTIDPNTEYPGTIDPNTECPGTIDPNTEYLGTIDTNTECPWNYRHKYRIPLEL